MAVLINASAQVSVEARIDSMEMFIGQQVHVQVTATADKNAKVVFPQLREQEKANAQPIGVVTPGVEIVDATDVDIRELDNGKAAFSRTYTLTSFDGRLYYLPPFVVTVNGKKYKSKSLALKVLDVQVDTTHVDKFFGNKDVQDNPFQWSEWSAVFWLSVLMLLLGALAYYLYLRLKDNKPIIANIKIVKRLLPHQKAMKEIEQIKADKMVTSENVKEYYTKLTDTLRTYIQERYGFNAMEMTSSEIIDRLNETQDPKALDELRSLFMTADLVKFAKYSTLINENDMNLVNAIEFINSTKMESQPVEEQKKPQLSEAEARTVKTRRTLKALIIAVAAVSIAILIYVVYTTYMLLV